jgi:molybdopterin-containing oxidoreductase family iron-sulfur binding subunit
MNMVINLDGCTGCVRLIACQAENNMAICNKKEISEGRNIEWLSIERFWVGENPDVRVRFLPILCQHCRDARCEPVCPVYASYHNPSGLNGQVLQPRPRHLLLQQPLFYAARILNFYPHTWLPHLNNQLNPYITVRRRRVMEKCTVCIQHIRRSKEDAKGDGHLVRVGEARPVWAQPILPMCWSSAT